MPRPFETRDDESRAAIQAVIEELPDGHPAREAYKVGADAVRLTYLVERDDLVEKLTQAWFDGYARMLRRQSNGKPTPRSGR